MPRKNASSSVQRDFSRTNGSRREEQAQLDALIAIYRHPAFRSGIQFLQKMFPRPYWGKEAALRDEAKVLTERLQTICRKHLKSGLILKMPEMGLVFDSRAESILSRWGLNRFPHSLERNLHWIQWLTQNWDLNKVDIPNPPHTVPVPKVSGVTTHYLEHPLNFADQKMMHVDQRHAWGCITIFPPASIRQARKAADHLCNLVNASLDGQCRLRAKQGRPSLSQADREAIRFCFKDLWDKSKSQSSIISKVQKTMDEWSRGPISKASIARELRLWRAEQGETIKRYSH